MTHAATDDGWVVKFVPFASSIDSPFWVRYCREKLETIQLSEEPIALQASYGVVDGPPRILCQENAFQSVAFTANERVFQKLTLRGFNTLESFQKCDKNKLLHDFFEPGFVNSNDEEVLASLTSVYLCVFPELKNHKVLYWMGMPALLTQSGKSIRALQQSPLSESWTKEERINLARNIDAMRHENLGNESTVFNGLPPYFVCSKSACYSLSRESVSITSQGMGSDSWEEIYFGFFDPVGYIPIQAQQPMGWPLRNLVAYLSYHLDLGGKLVNILSHRPKRVRRVMKSDIPESQPPIEFDDASIVLKIRVPAKDDYGRGVVGWELNARNKPGPRSVNLKPLLDENHLAVQAADLNLKLMKWRMIPDLQIELLQSTKILMIGAGTLGCSVARVLMGWGVRRMKIIDYGKVSYSNPVRQSLFTLEDCHFDGGSGKPKAQAASDALKLIAADVQSEGMSLSIPMPGHPETKDTIEASVNKLDSLVQECDVVFLLTDTRESRFLPTLLAATYDKMLINAALGLDSWLVMRHGGGVNLDDSARLGCYFCNDIVAPENSTKNRTLDQQCTVTRPGLAPIASSMAAELMVSLLHHPKRQSAPAPNAPAAGGAFSPTASRDDPSSSGPLGIIPHQIRGSLVSYTMMTPTVPAFKHCTACSQPVIEAYKEDKYGVVFNTCQAKDGSYLENISGLTTFRAEAAGKIADMEDWEDDE